jgi:hypothetical protein
VRPVVVVMLLVLARRAFGMPLVDDRESIEQFAADGADQAFCDRIRPRCSDGRPDDLMLLAVRTVSKGVNLKAKEGSRVRSRAAFPASLDPGPRVILVQCRTWSR